MQKRMMTNKCSLCKGLGMISGINGLMSKCPVCESKLKEFEQMGKNLINMISADIIDEEPVVSIKKEEVDQWEKKIHKNNKPLKRTKVNGKNKEEE